VHSRRAFRDARGPGLCLRPGHAPGAFPLPGRSVREEGVQTGLAPEGGVPTVRGKDEKEGGEDWRRTECTGIDRTCGGPSMRCPNLSSPSPSPGAFDGCLSLPSFATALPRIDPICGHWMAPGRSHRPYTRPYGAYKRVEGGREGGREGGEED